MNSKIKSVLYWVIANTVFALCVYYGFFEEVAGAKNIALFIAWGLSVLSLMYASDTVVASLKKRGKAIPAPIDVAYDLVIIGVFIWFGYIITAIAYTIHLGMLSYARDKAFGEQE